MEVKIRKETDADHDQVAFIIEEAFKNMPFSDQKEHSLVEKLRLSDTFIPELSLIAEINDKIVGHILLSRLVIRNKENSFPSLSLAPLSVLPSFQKKGIGSKLIQEAHNRAINLGFQSIILLGHEDYYPRFGYKMCKLFDIKVPFKAPDKNCMAIELTKDSLKLISGIVEYPPEFHE